MTAAAQTLPASPAKSYRIAKRALALDGKELGHLRDANALLGDLPALRQRMADDGYLLLRGLVGREKVLDARQRILEHLGPAVDRNFPFMEGRLSAGAKGSYLGGHRDITHTPEVLDVLEGAELAGFWGGYFEEDPLTIQYKWLRAVGNGDSTPPHYDVVYMGRGTREKLFTCWVPFGDIGYDEGPLALLAGSHNLPGYQKIRETYGAADADRDNIETFFSHDPQEIVERYGGQWQTAEFRAGDVIMFGMFTMHGSVANTSPKLRLSCDVRWQPASEPLDERWVGETPLGNYAWRKTPVEPLEVSREKWGV